MHAFSQLEENVLHHKNHICHQVLLVQIADCAQMIQETEEQTEKLLQAFVARQAADSASFSFSFDLA